MQGRSQKYQRVARVHLRRDGFLQRHDDIILSSVAARPDEGRAILRPIGSEGPHHVDHIFNIRRTNRPHVLIAMRWLWEATRLYFDRLGEIDLDRIAPGLEKGFDDRDNQWIEREAADMARSTKEPVKSPRLLAIKWTRRMGR